MYIPSSNAEPDLGVMHDFIEATAFGTLVTATSEGLYATHLPLLLDRARGPNGTLLGHMARANAHHKLAANTGESLVIFLGPDAYITPTWYASKGEHGKVVPTWNYVAVHVHGIARFVDDPELLRHHVGALTERHESTRAEPWSIHDAPAEYIAQQAKAIVGVELEIARIEGKWKMSQNRPAADIDGVVRGLGASPNASDRRAAEIVEARRPESSRQRASQ